MFLLFCFLGGGPILFGERSLTDREIEASGFAVRALLEVRRDFFEKTIKKRRKTRNNTVFSKKEKNSFFRGRVLTISI